MIAAASVWAAGIVRYIEVLLNFRNSQLRLRVSCCDLGHHEAVDAELGMAR
jgi:hypothetical protein